MTSATARPRIAIAGFQHETNTFALGSTPPQAFHIADSWPPLLRSSAVLTGTRGTTLPVAGFVAAAAPQAELVPLLWASAEPGGRVTQEAFDALATDIVDGLVRAGPVDAVYLDLHGAMVTEGCDDGEGLLLQRLRDRIGPDVPIAVSLDLHANLTARMVELASCLTIYRTYPHLDMAQTGARAFHALWPLLGGARRARAFRQASYLVPLQAQDTGAAPCKALYEAIAASGSGRAAWAELAMGFPSADTPDTGPAVLVQGDDPGWVEAEADRLLALVQQAEPAFDTTMVDERAAITRAKGLVAKGQGPVILADVQDNPGAGASSDTTGLLRALTEGGVGPAILGMLDDAESAAQAHAAGQGARLALMLGGRADGGPPPLATRVEVLALSDGRFAFTGAMYGGLTAEAGPTARLRLLDARAPLEVVIGSTRCQALDRAVFTHLGADLGDYAIVAVKSTVHFRADFEPGAAAVVIVASPGQTLCDLTALPWRRLRPGMRLGPLGPAYATGHPAQI